jgi:outer membrane protein assembly factor BamB
MRRMILCAAVLTSLLVPIHLAPGGDWPQWRGPDRNGHSSDTGLLTSWPEGGPKLVWKIQGLGIGYSSPAVTGGRLYTMGDREGASHVLAFDAASGKPLWATRLGEAGAPGWGGFAGPRCTPTVDGDRVYALGQYGELICVTAADGKEVWRRHLVNDFGGPLPEWGFTESPLVDGPRLVCTPGGPKGAIVLLNKKTGDVIWQSTEFTDPAAYASVQRAVIHGVPQYVQLTQESVVGVDTETGNVLWQAKRKGQTAVISDPIVKGNQVYVTSGYGVGCNLFTISKDGDGFHADQTYANKQMVNHHGGVVLVGDYLYGYSDGKGWVCQELETGKMVWREKRKLPKGAVTYADGRLYLRAEKDSGTIALIEATPDGYRETGRFEQPDRTKKNSWTYPIIAGGRLYVRDQDLLLCYDIQAR